MAKDKILSDAIRVAALMKDRETGKTRVRLIADRIVEEAVNGNLAAAAMVGDRLDGKPAQAIVGGDEGEELRIITEIRNIIVDPKADNA